MIYHSLYSYIFDMFAVGDPHLLRKPLESHLNISGGNIVLLLRVFECANFSWLGLRIQFTVSGGSDKRIWMTSFSNLDRIVFHLLFTKQKYHWDGRKVNGRTKLSKNNTFEIGGGLTHRHTHNLALYIGI